MKSNGLADDLSFRTDDIVILFTWLRGMCSRDFLVNSAYNHVSGFTNRAFLPVVITD
ncbi:hypothetical protein SAMN05428964_102225 [Thalassospira xiamenensis]|uniref:Uncharacterized protein n=1 Tax=Thalassospira xiamenensis TaxID=220697 RepID=A0A285T8Z5_9PROT|nr:hypothetical protein SAMN05428964_102225 [Thalassospira xiamenensis]